MNDPWKLISAEEARRHMLAVVPVTDVERVPLRVAAGRVLAEPLVAPHDLPPERRSAMDGYAVRAADLVRSDSSGDAGSDDGPSSGLPVGGAVVAGTALGRALVAGEVVSIATGSVIPDGADAVVMVEHTVPVAGASVEDGYVAPGGRVRVTKPVVAGANIVQAGEDVRTGVELLPRGRRLAARDLAALATFGWATVPVFRRPRIAVLTTGSEICAVEATPGPGQVRDSNEYVLAAELESAGADVTWGGVVPDDYDLLQSTVARLCAENDGVLLSGGSSIGPKDLTGRVLASLGPPGVIFHGIDIRPGKPTVFALAGLKPVVGMPGFPTSSIVVFEVFVRPMIARLCGETVDAAAPWATPVRARLSGLYRKPPGREDYLRVRLERSGGELRAIVIAGGASAISNILEADGLARIPGGITTVAEDGSVDDSVDVQKL